MKVKNVKLSDVKSYKNNPRKNEKAIEIVMRSIKEFGFKVPIILDKNDVIVAGHTRVMAAERLGMKELPAIYADDLNEKQIKAFRIMDNKSQDYAEWDEELLNEEFKFLNDSGFDMELTGFTEEDIDASLKLNEAENENVMGNRHEVIMLVPPEAPRLKERMMLKCDRIEDYKKIRDFFAKNERLLVDTLLGMVK